MQSLDAQAHANTSTCGQLTRMTYGEVSNLCLLIEPTPVDLEAVPSERIHL